MSNPVKEFRGVDVRLRDGARLVLDSTTRIVDEEGDWSVTPEQLRTAAEGGSVDAAGVLAGLQSFSPSDVVSAQEALAIESVRSAICGRHYNQIVALTPGEDAISTALAAIAAGSTPDTGLPSFKNRWLIYLPDGTYDQTVSIDLLSWVDIIGQSTDGVDIRSAANIDMVKMYNDESMLARCNIVCDYVVGAGTPKYPIHIDLGPNTVHGTTMVLYQVKTRSSNGNKSGAGVGIYNKQRLYLIDCDLGAESTAVGETAGLFVHGAYTATTSPAFVAVLNCTCTSATVGGSGFAWQSQGSTQPDLVMVVGGTFTGGAGGYGITEANAVNGAGEAYLSISDSVTGTTSFEHAARKINLGPSIPIPPAYAANFTQYLGTVQPGNDTGRWDVDGALYHYGSGLTHRATALATAVYSIWQGQNNYTRAGTSGSAGGVIFAGATPYASCFGSQQNFPVEFYQSDTRRLSITSTQITATLPVGAAAYAKSVRPTVTTPGVQIFQTDNTPGPRWWDGAHWITAAGAADD